MEDNSFARDKAYMKMAIDLACQGEGYTSPNPLVGAIVVKNDQIVGRGYHHQAGTPHAEVHALKDAGEKAREATIYVTLEPCCHYGRTPPCTEAIKKAGIKRVVTAMKDPNPLVAGHGIEILRQAGIEVTVGILAQEAKQMNEIFIKYITEKIPFVALKAAASLDGKIATATGESQWITGEAARNYGHTLRHRYDAILVGINTVLVDNPSLTTRLAVGEGKDPIRVVLDSQARTPLDAQILNQKSNARTIIATTNRAEQNRVVKLKEKGAEVLILPDKEGRVDIPSLMRALGERQITSMLIEGGANVHWSFLQENSVDKVHWFIAPKIIGGKVAPSAVGGGGIKNLTDAFQLEQIRLQTLEKDICVEGYLRQGV